MITNLKIKQTNTFKKTLKKIPKQYKSAIDKEIKKIVQKPNLGTKKKGDLSLLRVHKFKLNQKEFLLGYHHDENKLTLTLLQLASHENFYRDIKRLMLK